MSHEKSLTISNHGNTLFSEENGPIETRDHSNIETHPTKQTTINHIVGGRWHSAHVPSIDSFVAVWVNCCICGMASTY